jgi:hypothetical protein
VRAIGPEGRSAETLSDGVRFIGACDRPDAGTRDAETDAGARDAGTDTGPDGLDVDFYRDAARASDVCRTARCLLLEGRAGPIGSCTCDAAPGAPSGDGSSPWIAVLGSLLGAGVYRKRARSWSKRSS